MKQKWFAVGMAILMTASVAACGNSSSNEEKQEETKTVAETKGDVLSVDLERHFDYEWSEVVDDYAYKLTAEKLKLGESTIKEFPELAKSVTEYNDQLETMYAEQKSDLEAAVTAELDEQAELDGAEYEGEDGTGEVLDDESFFTPYEYKTSLLVKRADTSVLSVLEVCSGYMGGPHPNVWYDAENFDVKTGKRLNLSDVLTDTASLKKIVSEKLTERYPNTEFFDLEGSLHAFLDENGEYRDRVAWILGSQGVTFYFSPYELASYADGTLTATIYYNDEPSLFKEAYTQTPDSYTVAITPYETMEYDLDGDGKGEDISVFLQEGDYEYIEALSVSVGERATEVEAYCYSVDSYLVHTPNGNYLYADTVSDNDYHTIYCLELNKNGVKSIGEMNSGFAAEDDETGDPDYFICAVFTSPESFVLNTKIDVLSTYFGQITYHVGEDGLPAADDDMYRINVGYHLDVVQDLPVEVLDDDFKPTGEKATLKPGDSLVLVQGDGVKSVDVVAKDGKYYRITVGFDDDEWWQTIDGKNAEDYFEMLYFAG